MLCCYSAPPSFGWVMCEEKEVHLISPVEEGERVLLVLENTLVAMGSELETTGRRRENVHFVNAGVPCTIEENFEGLLLEYGDLSFEEVLQDQEILYQSLQTNIGKNTAKASASSDANPENDQGGKGGMVVEKGESSHINDVAAQLAQDEALAKAMQEQENQMDGTSISAISGTPAEIGPSASSTINRERGSTDSSVVSRQDNIDPDNMTYEELQSLTETVGTESRGLSDELIGYLPSFKTGFFSKRDKHDECVICRMAYKYRQTLTTLPCLHQYHSKCIRRWLKINKACPVCNEEVFGS